MSYYREVIIKKNLRCEMIKPPNNKANNIAKLPTVMEAPWLWKIEDISLNMDNADKCTPNRIKNC